MRHGRCQRRWRKTEVHEGWSSGGASPFVLVLKRFIVAYVGYANRAMTLFEVDYCGGISRNRVVNTRFRGKSSQKKEKRFRGKKDD